MATLSTRNAKSGLPGRVRSFRRNPLRPAALSSRFIRLSGPDPAPLFARITRLTASDEAGGGLGSFLGVEASSRVKNQLTTFLPIDLSSRGLRDIPANLIRSGMAPSNPTPGGWPSDEHELRVCYVDYKNWSQSRRDRFDLETLRARLWETAAAPTTAPAGDIMSEFHFAHGDHLRAAGYVVEIVSEHNRLILQHPGVYLSSVVVQKSTMGKHDGGLPLSKYFDTQSPTPQEIREMILDRKATQSYCRRHPFAIR